MSPTVLDSITLTELFVSAVEIAGGDTIISSTITTEEVFVYKLANATDTSATVDLISVGGFNGRVEVYKGSEFLKCNFVTLSGQAVITDTDRYTVSEDFYYNIYNENSPIEPTVTDYLNNISVGAETGTVVRFSTHLAPGESVYYLVNTSTDYIIEAEVVTDNAPTIELPSVPETTTPGLNEVVSVKGMGPYNLSLPQEILESIQNVPVNVSVAGTTDKVVQVTIRYGSYSNSTGYLYDPDQVVNLESLADEIISATGNPDAVLVPMTGEHTPAGDARKMVDLNIIGDSNTKLEIIVNAPISNTTFKTQAQMGPPTATPVSPNDTEADWAREDETGEEVRRRLRVLGYF